MLETPRWAHRWLQAARTAWRRRRASIPVVAVIATGIVPAAGVLNVVDALQVRGPLHVRMPNRLVIVRDVRTYAEYRSLAETSKTLEIAGFSQKVIDADEGDRFTRLSIECVSANYMDVLGLQPLAGTLFGRQTADESRAVVVSYGLWRRHFGEDKQVIGRTMQVGQWRFTVIGVTPAGFNSVSDKRVDAWLLLTPAEPPCSLAGLQGLSDNRLTAIGRIQPHASAVQAEVEANSLLGRVSSEASDGPDKRRALQTLSDFRKVRAQLGPLVLTWLAAGAIVLLGMASATGASLLLAAAIDRRREVVRRLQMGAESSDMIATGVAELMLVATLCVPVVLLALAAISVLVKAMLPLADLEAWNVRTVLIVLATVVAVCAVSGLPTLLAIGHQCASVDSREHEHRALGRRKDLTIIAEVSVAAMFLAATGMFVKSVTLASSGLGFEPRNVVVGMVDSDGATRLTPDEVTSGYYEWSSRVRQSPLVVATAVSSAPLLGIDASLPFVRVARKGDARPIVASIQGVSGSYFDTVGTNIVRGRGFSEADMNGPTQLVVIGARIARAVWPDSDPIGQCAYIGAEPCALVIGVAEPRRSVLITRYASEVFVPLEQANRYGKTIPLSRFLFVRLRDSGIVERGLGAGLVGSAAPFGRLARTESLGMLAAEQVESRRTTMVLSSALATSAVALAAIGVYSVLGFSVKRRRREIGIRLALGATRCNIALMVFRYGLMVVVIGEAIGTVTSIGLAVFIGRLMFGVARLDPQTFLVGLGIIAVAGVAAAIRPVVLAITTEPAVALLSE